MGEVVGRNLGGYDAAQSGQNRPNGEKILPSHSEEVFIPPWTICWAEMKFKIEASWENVDNSWLTDWCQ